MAILTKNIDTRQHGSLKAGRLLNGVLPAEKIAELIASGHAEPTEHDDLSVTVGKSAENASGERESLFEDGFSVGYATAINDAIDSEIISVAEAEAHGLHIPFDDDGAKAAPDEEATQPPNDSPKEKTPAAGKTEKGKGKKQS